MSDLPESQAQEESMDIRKTEAMKKIEEDYQQSTVSIDKIRESDFIQSLKQRYLNEESTPEPVQSEESRNLGIENLNLSSNYETEESRAEEKKQIAHELKNFDIDQYLKEQEELKSPGSKEGQNEEIEVHEIEIASIEKPKAKKVKRKGKHAR